ncbi:hypothetical protein CDAR_10101 [Caerostris darwini]|uniref:Uncharacterized protein n=1 Tax=Caerostris darwini TaxID=1538125 RepID=A0AAV4WKB3_9ARAC|nr:hypothetical protein CDAR_10101 [Caerostris darwini]
MHSREERSNSSLLKTESRALNGKARVKNSLLVEAEWALQSPENVTNSPSPARSECDSPGPDPHLRLLVQPGRVSLRDRPLAAQRPHRPLRPPPEPQPALPALPGSGVQVQPRVRHARHAIHRTHLQPEKLDWHRAHLCAPLNPLMHGFGSKTTDVGIWFQDHGRMDLDPRSRMCGFGSKTTDAWILIHDH